MSIVYECALETMSLSLQITDENTGTQLFRESGTKDPRVLSTNSNHVKLRFTSDSSGTRKGFRVGYYGKNLARLRVMGVTPVR